MKLFQRLLKENAKVWDEYLHHSFVKELEKGTLKEENFLFYLKQDYIYLINYAKCYALLALNANNAKELRFAMKFQNYIVEGELELHKSILKLGIDADKLCVKDESIVNIAYTRYMLSVGQSGDFLDMLVALSACAIGYGYIGAEIKQRLSKDELEKHPYKEWILTYSGEVFQAEIKEFEDFLNSYEVDENKFKKLSEIFHTVVRLEREFWQHGLNLKLDLY
ncbi:transcriptional regulator, TenA family [Campylobacter avium LMG 24591]|uniref:Aminopyrimidine aminohydrolase n=1 Tax=Campylobacter avium LMG 24591 TaxID=522484 RepID=A0A222MWK1_9BACT|nr:thiaminase II [Campylobacter avium]ASQ30052.1 transcriptional regulator, TenA family [Campylobacter avium LMG 24591]OYD79151.1 transcriptional regulator, TenA family [Campylobacter avium]